MLNEVLGLKPLFELIGVFRTPRPTWSMRFSRKPQVCEEVLQPLNKVGDEVGCKRNDDGSVATPPGFKEAYKQFCEAGWPTLTAPEEYGGQGLRRSSGPRSANMCFPPITASKCTRD